MSKNTMQLLDMVWENLLYSESEPATNGNTSDDSLKEILERIADELLTDT